MELQNYIYLKKDFINSEIMELATELAAHRLMIENDKRFDELTEQDRADQTNEQEQDDTSFHYKEKYQRQFDTYYDEAYNRIAGLMKFDTAQDSGIDNSKKEDVLCKEMAYAVNGSFSFQAFAQCIGRQHPTVQQRMFRLMQTSMIYMASGAIHIDDRNRASFQLCAKMKNILENHHLPMI